MDSLFVQYQKKATPFNGILLARLPSEELLLFILQGEPYAAVSLSEDVFKPVDIHSYFSGIGLNRQVLLSLFSVDPVFFKSLLVFFHKKPSTKATMELINLERLLEELEEEKKEIVLGFRQEEGLDLFYFREGKMVSPYYLFPDSVTKEGSLMEQLLVYTYTAASKNPIEVFVFQDVQVPPAHDRVPSIEFLPMGVVGYFLFSYPEIIVSSEKGVVKTLKFEKGAITIGRGPKNDLVLEDDGASREHAVMMRQGNKYILKDLDSLNGTLLNGESVKVETLKDEDRIKIGNHTILFLEKHAFLTGDSQDGHLSDDSTRLISDPLRQNLESALPLIKNLLLEVIEGHDVGKVIEVLEGTRDKAILGRADSDVIISDPAISRQHASIERQGEGFLFRDLKSRNGSYVNDEYADSKVLVENDTIKMGKTTLKIIIS